ncbi:outer membrane beta-barrel protein [Pseudoduganella plicata]|uniref:Porin family protein n=1 Tax=Pseudoduganella plicata TaxID=321984 RepID=A0A4P7BLD2_9BURK|nr:outer membrane beta-barrel protein [Pseudoduganella plicata]QBQ39047.1 porin family protein [Pseudoduganella plicata]GGY86775.1 hypothetical protein GCM10007388_20080 [Pseudoduganella plicata]
MKLIHSILALAFLVMGGAQAQFGEQSTDFHDRLGRTSTPAEKAWQPRARIYGRSVAENSNDRLYKGMFKTDPRLLIGVELSPNWALEAGYVNLFDRGFHRVNERDPGDTAGALGANGSSTHAAIKYSGEITDRLSAYGKVGIAYSETTTDDRKAQTGLYTGVGVKLKMNERMWIGVEYGSHGGGLKSLGDSNANAVKVNVGIRF